MHRGLGSLSLLVAASVVGCTALVSPDPGRLGAGEDTSIVGTDAGHIELDAGGDPIDAFSLTDAPGLEDASESCAAPCEDGRLCVDGSCVCPEGACCPGCGADEACLAGTCAPCGGLNQFCCGDRCAGADAICLGGRCAQCGRPGDPCCAGGGCVAPATCDGTTCHGTCGEVGQACCTGNRCALGTVCAGSFPLPMSCAVCGGVGQPCCDGGTCAGDALACDRGGNCQTCGGALETCCTGGRCRDARTCRLGTCA